jgi:hypothetical protein
VPLKDKQDDVHKVWTKFLEKTGQIDTGKIKSRDTQSDRTDDKRLTMKTLFSAVKRGEERLSHQKSSFPGKVKSGLLGVVNILNEYPALFSIIPTQDRYLTLITGVVSSIANVRSRFGQWQTGSAHGSHWQRTASTD